MSVFNRRSKMLSIRLSDEEYRHLRTICEVRGARSVSDLAREAMLQLMPSHHARNGDASVLSRIEELDERISLLQSEVSRLSVRLGPSV